MGMIVNMKSTPMIGVSIKEIEDRVLEEIKDVYVDCKIHVNNDTVSLICIEKYFARKSGNVNLTLMLSFDGNCYEANIVSSEDSKGIIDTLFPAEDDFVGSVVKALELCEFTEVNSKTF